MLVRLVPVVQVSNHFIPVGVCTQSVQLAVSGLVFLPFRRSHLLPFVLFNSMKTTKHVALQLLLNNRSLLAGADVNLTGKFGFLKNKRNCKMSWGEPCLDGRKWVITLNDTGVLLSAHESVSSVSHCGSIVGFYGPVRGV